MTPQSPAPVAGDEPARPASDQPVEAVGVEREEEVARIIHKREFGGRETWDQATPAYRSHCLATAADILAALSPASPARTPMGGWPEVTDAWAETYCELTGRNPDGQQVTFVDGGTVTTFRDMAKREIEAMLCAAPKSAVRALAAPTPMGGEVEALRDVAQRALEELRLIRAKDTNAVYDTTLRTDLQLALAASSPSPAQGGEQIARKAEMYDHMREVAAANGFDSLTQAIAEAYAARQAVSASPQPEAGEEDPSHHQVWTQERGWEHPTPPSVQPVEGK